MSTRIEKALLMAMGAHKEQVRKDADTPYIIHPVMVAFKLVRAGFDEVVVAAALVHDVPEDTALTIDDIRTELGDEVADIVASVTNNDSLGWEDKKLAYIKSVRDGSGGAKAVAVADKIHNAESLIAAHALQGPALWAHFNAGREKKLWFEETMLAMVKETWNHPLVTEYETLVQRMRELV